MKDALMGYSPEVRELLAALGIDVREQLVKAVTIYIDGTKPVEVEIERYVPVPGDIGPPAKLLRRYRLVPAELAEESKPHWRKDGGP